MDDSSDFLTSMKHFRPIILCNVSYKIFTKVMTARLRRVMEDLIALVRVASSYIVALEITLSLPRRLFIFHEK